VFVVKSKNEVEFSEEERKMIKQWGNEKVGDVTDSYLFRMHKEHFYPTLQYARPREELKKVWDNYKREQRKKK